MQNKHIMKMLDYTQTLRQWNPKEQLFSADWSSKEFIQHINKTPLSAKHHKCNTKFR